MEGKDAFASVTNWSLIATAISMYLNSQGIFVDVTTVTQVLGLVGAAFGRWKAGGIKSVAGVALPQPK